MSSPAARTSAAVSLFGVTKTFGGTTAVDALDLTIPRGALYGFIGPNGAGKTTSIRLIMSILFPDAGEVSVLGHKSALEAKDRIGYLPEERGVYRKMKVGTYLGFIARLKGMREQGLGKRVRELVGRVGLAGVEDKRCEDLSKGMLQKIQFVAAIVHGPDLLILDEPFSGLDPVSMRLLRDLIIAEHQRGATILFSTHVMHQAEEICDHIVMIHRGRKVLDDPVGHIRGRHDSRVITVEPLHDGNDLASVRSLAQVESVGRADDGYDVLLRAGADAADAMRAIVGALPVARIELKRPSLEDVFIDLVTTGASSEAERRLRAELGGVVSQSGTEVPEMEKP
jgi:ABC-2 type transport system ATP-binding protein